ncbi:hypothetical protein PRZ48_003654 [Zasmidium cellare]|uniref:Uncharacterized protein n=1 Tax=Zasmidium cellare TaxID=395010 RepID=A0ABR0EVP5_ZASCE|nr:hypothetical protein PRZ48_003654 [Zasmidium cellare]
MASKFTQQDQGRITQVSGQHQQAPVSGNKRSRAEAGLTQDSAANAPAKRPKLALPTVPQREVTTQVSPPSAAIPTAAPSTEPAGQPSGTLFGQSWEDYARTSAEYCAQLGLPVTEEEVFLTHPQPAVEPFIGPAPAEGFDLTCDGFFQPLPGSLGEVANFTGYPSPPPTIPSPPSPPRQARQSPEEQWGCFAPAPQQAHEVVDLTSDDGADAPLPPAQPSAPQPAGPVIDLTGDDSSPSSEPLATPSAPQPAPVIRQVDQRSPLEREREFLAMQMQGLREEQAKTGIYDGPANISKRTKTQKSTARMQTFREDARRAREAEPIPWPDQQRLQQQREEKAEQRKIANRAANARLRARKKAEKEAEKKATAAAAPAAATPKRTAKKGASPRQKVQASPAPEGRPSPASTEQDARARKLSGDSLQSELNQQKESSTEAGSGEQTPITSPEAVSEEDLAAQLELAMDSAVQSAGEEKEDDDESLFGEREAAAAEVEDDNASLFGEEEENDAFAELFGEEDEPAAAPAEPIKPAPKPRVGLVLPLSARKD